VKNIIFCGPFGGRKGKVGGGESGNRKTLEILKNNGFEVDIVEKPYPMGDTNLYAFIYALQILNYIFRYIYQMLRSPTSSTIHITGFYGHLIYLEFIFLLLARIFSKRVIYELRAGGAVEFYTKGHWLYRIFFSFVVRKSTVVLCQGQEYVTFLMSEFSKTGVYYPNFIEGRYFYKYGVESIKSSLDNTVNLAYVGRIVESKNILHVIEIVSILKSKGIRVSLDLIGPCEGQYKQSLVALIHKLNVSSEIKFKGVLESEALFAQLEKAHFFIFPTEEKREGHSNSLTEAMACGVVPISTNIGFNRTVVGADDLIISCVDSVAFSEKIFDIWMSGDWERYSCFVRQRVKENFLDVSVEIDLISAHVDYKKGSTFE
jgi:glycosyltransferase involved in cell wall biosynthesis